MCLNISFLKDMKNKYLIFILIGILVLVMCIPTEKPSEESGVEIDAVQAENLELQLKRVLSVMEGVGSVEVMIVTEGNENGLFGQTTVTPKVCGVVVVAEGAGNATVNMRISEAVKALFSIDAHKISIVKMRSQEDDR